MRFPSPRPLLNRLSVVSHAIVDRLRWPLRVVFRRSRSRHSDHGSAYAWQDILPDESQVSRGPSLPEHEESLAPSESPLQEPQGLEDLQEFQELQELIESDLAEEQELQELLAPHLAEQQEPREARPEGSYEEASGDTSPSHSPGGFLSGVKDRLARTVRFVLRRKEPAHPSAFAWRDIMPDESGDDPDGEEHEGVPEGSKRRWSFSGIWSSIRSGWARAVRFVLRRKEPSRSSAFHWRDVLPDGTVSHGLEEDSEPVPEGASRWQALSRIAYLARKRWARLVRFVLRREALTEEEERLWEEGYFDVAAEWSSLTTPPKIEKWWSPKNLARAANNIVRRRTMTITVENGIVRVVVFQGKQAIAWGTANPEEDFDPSGLELGALTDGYAYRLYALLKELKFGRIRLVTELPLYTPLLRQLQLPGMKRKYFDPIVLTELLEMVPFSEEEVDIKWQHRKNELGHEIFAATVPKRVVDKHVNTLKRGNVRPSATYSRAIALAFATTIPEAVVVHLTLSEAAIALVREGLPRVIHKVSLSNWEEAPRGRAEDIARAIEQVVSSAQAPAAREDEDGVIDTREYDAAQVPVVLTGQLATESSITEALEQVIQREIYPFMPPVEYPEDFPPEEYAANIGLMLADRSRGKSGDKLSKKKLPSVNLLSERHLPKPFPMRPVAAFVAILLFGVAGINVTAQVESMALNVTTLSNRVESLERQARLYRLSASRTRALEENIGSAKQFTTSLESQIGELEVDMKDLLAQMEAITQEALPPDVKVISLTMNGSEFAISGKASSYDDVIQFTKNLRAIEPSLFSVVKILRLSSADGAELVDEDSEARKGSVGFQVKADTYSPADADEEDVAEKGTARPGGST